MCFHEHTSHRSSGNADCGRIVAILGDKTFLETPRGARKGDSGALSFNLPGGGLVGVLSTSYEIEDRNGNTSYVVTANEPASGRKLSVDEESQIINRHYGTNVRLLEHDITPGSSLVEGLADAGSSDAEGAAIALVLISLLLGGMAIGAMLNNALF